MAMMHQAFPQNTSKMLCDIEECINNVPKNQPDDILKGFYRIDPSIWRNSPPLVNALKSVAEQNVASFLFPGHTKGQAIPLSMAQLIGQKPFLHDISEVDNLSTPRGPILEAQKQASEVFGASKTWFLVGGTTCGIHAAIMAACNPGDTLIIPRNSHKSATSAMVLGGLIPKYIFPDYDFDWDIPTVVSPSQVQKAIEELELEGLKPGAVFITSPTYHGICSNIKEISTLCHHHNIPLIVDEAHGAHFGFHPSLPLPALQQGADVVVQSTHKVLLSLTQSSMLHLSHNNTLIDKDKISKCLSTLQSTSPSPLLLASLDATSALLKDNPSTIFDNPINLAAQAKQSIKQIPGFSVLDYPSMDPLRVTTGVFGLGFSGHEVDDFLFMDQMVVSELPGSRFITFPFSPGTSKEHVDRLISGFKNFILSPMFIQRLHQRSHTLYHSIKKRDVDLEPWSDIEMKLTPREAFFAKKKRVDIEIVVGKICGESVCPFPPGVPIITPGEVISERVLQILMQCKLDGATLVGASDPLLSSMLICDI